MISGRQEKIRAELEAGTGAAIGMAVDQSGLRTGLRLWFDDLDDRHGPVVEMKPFGMRGYRVTLGFGKFAGEVIRQIQAAGPDDVGLARALVNSIDDMVELDLSGQARSDWLIDSGAFKITATARGLVADPDDAVTLVSRDIIVPLMAAMAELIGYDVIVEEEAEEAAFEGAILVSTVRRRERNPGTACFASGFTVKNACAAVSSQNRSTVKQAASSRFTTSRHCLCSTPRSNTTRQRILSPFARIVTGRSILAGPFPCRSRMFKSTCGHVAGKAVRNDRSCPAPP